ncbi:MAG TPA: prenyltransferase/squalene oxidase repeat-containing protein [Lacipirellulaceae bacterium]|nr:prenyltransferase/squalene oxidase repeat-containing protein [Lacipirellulaceae bacterium]
MEKPPEPPAANSTPRLTAARGDESLDGLLSSAPPWLVSLIIHCALLLVVGLAAVEVRRQQTAEMDVELAPLGDDEVYAETLGEQLETPQPTLDQNLLATEIDTGYAISDLPPVDDPLAAPPVSLEPSTGASEGYFADVEAPSIGWALSGRQEGRKDALLRAYGGTATTQQSVDLALKWLAKQQGRDGLWSLRGPYADGASSENELAATAMALLAFLGDGHTHVKEGPYARVVARGMRGLIKMQGDDGEFVAERAPAYHRLYTHAQCTIVLCELYALTEDSLVREAARKAVDYSVKIQAPEGGWRYYPYQEADMSVTGWFVMALESARMAQLEVPTPTFDRVRKFLNSVATDGGTRYRYLPERAPSVTMTAEALLCRQYLGWPRTEPRLLDGVEYLSGSPVDWSRPNVYHWYYATQVMHHMGGEHWIAWNKVMRQVVPENQEKRGAERGSWDPAGDQWGTTAGRLYMTCLSTYMLEVYYRHLPLYSLKAKGAPAESAEAESERVDSAGADGAGAEAQEM